MLDMIVATEPSARLGIGAPIVALLAVAQAGNVFNDIANALSHLFR